MSNAVNEATKKKGEHVPPRVEGTEQTPSVMRSTQRSAVSLRSRETGSKTPPDFRVNSDKEIGVLLS